MPMAMYRDSGGPLGGSGPMTERKWLVARGDRCCPLRIGLWDRDPFQMAELYGL